MRPLTLLALLLTLFALAACAAAAPSEPVASDEAVAAATAVGEQANGVAAAAATAVAAAEASAPTGDSSSSGRVATFPNPLIVYEREGRFPGSPQQWTVYPTGRVVRGDGSETQLAADIVAPLFALAADPELLAMQGRYAPQGECSDCTTHTLTLYGPDSPATMTVVEGADLQAAPKLQKMMEILQSLLVP